MRLDLLNSGRQERSRRLGDAGMDGNWRIHIYGYIKIACVGSLRPRHTCLCCKIYGCDVHHMNQIFTHIYPYSRECSSKNGLVGS